VIRRLTVRWPGPLPDVADNGRPVRLVAVSDETERGLEDERNRSTIGPVDGILGAGDLEPDYLSFLADAFRAPLVLVRGNHDRGGAWEHNQHLIPTPLDTSFETVGGIVVAGLSWPSWRAQPVRRDDPGAWSQALRLAWRARVRGPSPQIILSHVPPKGLGDSPTDPYHAGFAGYRWLVGVLRPVLWIHGHTTLAAAENWRTTWKETTVINVTGAAVIEIEPDPRAHARDEDRAA
jgi:hypothetical protein